MSEWKSKPNGDGWYKIKKMIGTMTAAHIKGQELKFTKDENYYQFQYMLGLQFFGPIHENLNGPIFKKTN